MRGSARAPSGMLPVLMAGLALAAAGLPGSGSAHVWGGVGSPLLLRSTGRSGALLRSHVSSWQRMNIRGGGDAAPVVGGRPFDPSAQVGIGMGIKKNKQGEHVITKLAKGWPAERSGHVKEGDIIIDVNGTPADEMDTKELMRELRGLPGSCLSLLLRRGGSIESIELERELPPGMQPPVGAGDAAGPGPVGAEVKPAPADGPEAGGAAQAWGGAGAAAGEEGEVAAEGAEGEAAQPSEIPVAAEAGGAPADAPTEAAAAATEGAASTCPEEEGGKGSPHSTPGHQGASLQEAGPLGERAKDGSGAPAKAVRTGSPADQKQGRKSAATARPATQGAGSPERKKKGGKDAAVPAQAAASGSPAKKRHATESKAEAAASLGAQECVADSCGANAAMSAGGASPRQATGTVAEGSRHAGAHAAEGHAAPGEQGTQTEAITAAALPSQSKEHARKDRDSRADAAGGHAPPAGGARPPPPRAAAAHTQDLSGEVGLELECNVHGDFMVTEVAEGGPAGLSGKVAEGDILTMVGGELVEGLSMQQLRDRLRGPQQTQVRLSFSRWTPGTGGGEGTWSERTLVLTRKHLKKTKLPVKAQAQLKAFKVNLASLDALEDMGFPKADATRALYATNNRIEDAVDWLAKQLPSIPEDSPYNEIDVPEMNLAEAGHLEEAGVPTMLSANSNPVEDLMALGFTRMQVEKALRRTQGRVMLAADMLLEKQARKEKRNKDRERRERMGLTGITGMFRGLWSGKNQETIT